MLWWFPWHPSRVDDKNNFNYPLWTKKNCLNTLSDLLWCLQPHRNTTKLHLPFLPANNGIRLWLQVRHHHLWDRSRSYRPCLLTLSPMESMCSQIQPTTATTTTYTSWKNPHCYRTSLEAWAACYFYNSPTHSHYYQWGTSTHIPAVPVSSTCAFYLPIATAINVLFRDSDPASFTSYADQNRGPTLTPKQHHLFMMSPPRTQSRSSRTCTRSTLVTPVLM